MKFYLVLAVTIQSLQFIQAVCPVKLSETQFEAFLFKYNYSFPDPVEYAARLQIFTDNLDLINHINSNPTLTYKAAINAFAALVIIIFNILSFIFY